MRKLRGFSLVEMLIVVVIIAIIATIALPNLLSSKIDANETAAVTTLRQTVQSQLLFANRGEADLNGNGMGEFGTFGEMSGNIAVRAASGGTKFLDPGVINPSFRTISPTGEMFRSGYYFRIYLPGPAAEGILELPGGGAAPTVDPDRAEQMWCAYAWPQNYGASGRRTYFVNQHGDILWTESSTYSGAAAPIVPAAAFLPGGPAVSINGTMAVNQVAQDGNTWHAVGR
jgi:prepilin-type N-terminal cleavage/methylation domain-containing protein